MTHQQTKNKIDRIEPTSDTLTSRADLTPWVRYLERINIYQLLDRYFGSIRKSSKGARWQKRSSSCCASSSMARICTCPTSITWLPTLATLPPSRRILTTWSHRIR